MLSRILGMLMLLSATFVQGNVTPRSTVHSKEYYNCLGSLRHAVWSTEGHGFIALEADKNIFFFAPDQTYVIPFARLKKQYIARANEKNWTLLFRPANISCIQTPLSLERSNDFLFLHFSASGAKQQGQCVDADIVANDAELSAVNDLIIEGLEKVSLPHLRSYAAAIKKPMSDMMTKWEWCRRLPDDEIAAKLDETKGRIAAAQKKEIDDQDESILVGWD